ncbi:hypothetical protein EAX61_12825 [Dokdonia sinensis]|uniref:Uncharacterized protein n=1 Tax=Dokdonia sinensis TaxID=2479847 RepID=A0A3M0FW83_9FLAO|nr:hypothetical protein [Dokdonia sinensis]RMB56941.1 hypothetical protein EAX61_12825 [Dokdonia sinensis]
MKTINTIFLCIIGILVGFAQAPTLLHEVIDLPACESAVYHPETELIYTSYMGGREAGDGGIATVSLDGQMVNKNFISGLDDPKGILIQGDKLYVGDNTVFIEADLKTGEILKRHTLPSIGMLNDATIAPDGKIYVTDTRTSEIYELDTEGNFSLWLKDAGLDNPNGILIHDNTMYIASWGGSEEGGAVSKIDMKTKEITPLTEKIGNLDGVRPYDDNHLIISDWRSGKIHTLNLDDGSTKEILEVGQSVGDIAYIADKKLLLLPMNRQKKLLIYKL